MGTLIVVVLFFGKDAKAVLALKFFISGDFEPPEIFVSASDFSSGANAADACCAAI